MEILNTILGGFLASALGLVAFFIQEYFRKKAEKRKVANALMNEMLHTLKFFASSHKRLTGISRQHESLSASEIDRAYPSRRTIYVSVGADVGALSEKAAEAAVNFDHYIQAIERDFDFLFGEPSANSGFPPETAGELANKIRYAIECTAGLVECMADDVGGKRADEAKKKITLLKKIIENNVKH